MFIENIYVRNNIFHAQNYCKDDRIFTFQYEIFKGRHKLMYVKCNEIREFSLVIFQKTSNENSL